MSYLIVALPHFLCYRGRSAQCPTKSLNSITSSYVTVRSGFPHLRIFIHPDEVGQHRKVAPWGTYVVDNHHGKRDGYNEFPAKRKRPANSVLFTAISGFRKFFPVVAFRLAKRSQAIRWAFSSEVFHHFLELCSRGMHCFTGPSVVCNLDGKTKQQNRVCVDGYVVNSGGVETACYIQRPRHLQHK